MNARGREELARGSDGPASLGARVDEPPPSSIGSNRRSVERVEVTWSVDCETDDTFLYASITNISELGIFVQTIEPLPVGCALTLRFAPRAGAEPFVLRGSVQWVNRIDAVRETPNPGMGIRFVDLAAEDRERLVEAIHTIAYLRDDPTPSPDR
jgi:type IV pilus assembly protein PilZ